MNGTTSNQTIDDSHNDIQKARIEQLLAYMSDCQQGFRDLNSQIQTILTVISTLLTLVFGYSVIRALSESDDLGHLLNLPENSGPLNGRFYRILNSLVTIRRINFWLTSAIILIGVLFITCLEIEKILRYQYSQHLADRLHDLIPGTLDDRVRNALVTYQQFASPIKTNNLFHVSNSHNLFNFCAIYASGFMIGSICLVLVVVQFILIKDYHWYDWFSLVLVLMPILIDGIMLIRFSWYTDSACDMAFYMANENLEVRKGLSEYKKLYWWADDFLKFLSYLVYPRKESLYKALLTVGGFAATCVMGGKFYISHLVYILIVFELFLYQARYQFNDLRGLDENKKYTQNKLVNFVDPKKPSRIIVSIAFTIVRVLMAIVFIYFLGGSIKVHLFYCMCALLILSIFYEISRYSNCGLATIFLSGAGFVIRFSVGALAADGDVVEMCWKNYYTLFIIIAIILWLWGIVTSLLVWVKDIERLILTDIHHEGKPFPKDHYNIIYQFIRERIKRLKEKGKSGSVVSEKNDAKDPWCWIYWTILILLLGCWCWYILAINHANSILSFFEIPALLTAVFVIINDSDEMIFKTKYCLIFALISIYIAYISKLPMKITIIYNIFLISFVFSICVLRNKGLNIITILKHIASFIFGEKAIQMLKKPKEE